MAQEPNVAPDFELFVLLVLQQVDDQVEDDHREEGVRNKAHDVENEEV